MNWTDRIIVLLACGAVVVACTTSGAARHHRQKWQAERPGPYVELQPVGDNLEVVPLTKRELLGLDVGDGTSVWYVGVRDDHALTLVEMSSRNGRDLCLEHDGLMRRTMRLSETGSRVEVWAFTSFERGVGPEYDECAKVSRVGMETSRRLSAPVDLELRRPVASYDEVVLHTTCDPKFCIDVERPSYVLEKVPTSQIQRSQPTGGRPYGPQ